MPGLVGPKPGYWLVCATHAQEDDPAGARRHLEFVRELRENEALEITDGSTFLGALADGPCLAVARSIDDLFASRHQLLNDPAFRYIAKRTNLRDRFSFVLYTFRQYLNRVQYELSNRYGANSDELSAFVQATATEYDSSFNYRLAYNLRNESDHKRSVAVVTASGEHIDASTERRTVTLALRDDVINEASTKTGWQASVVRELQAHSRPIELDQLLHDLRDAVLRIESITLDAQREHIEGAGHTIEAAMEGLSCEGEVLVVNWLDTASTPQRMTTLSLHEQIGVWLSVDLLRHGRERSDWPTWLVPAGTALFVSGRLHTFSSYLQTVMAIDSKVSFTEPDGVTVELRAPTKSIARRLVGDAAFNSGLSPLVISEPREAPPRQTPP